MGYSRAGWEVVGVDNMPQPHYPFEFHQADAMTFPLDGFDAIHASPPCQKFSPLKSMTHDRHLDLLTPTRVRLLAQDAPWIIENVPGAPMRVDVLLCGEMFDLRTIRHRWFESSISLTQPTHRLPHSRPTSTRKRPKRFAEGYHISVTGDVGRWVGPACMGIDWMNGNELSQAIPPAYTSYIGRQLLEAVTCGAAN